MFFMVRNILITQYFYVGVSEYNRIEYNTISFNGTKNTSADTDSTEDRVSNELFI